MELWCVFVCAAAVVVVIVVDGIVCAIGLCVIYASLFIDAPTGVALFPKSRLSAAGVRSPDSQNRPDQTRIEPNRLGHAMVGLVMASLFSK